MYIIFFCIDQIKEFKEIEKVMKIYKKISLETIQFNHALMAKYQLDKAFLHIWIFVLFHVGSGSLYYVHCSENITIEEIREFVFVFCCDGLVMAFWVNWISAWNWFKNKYHPRHRIDISNIQFSPKFNPDISQNAGK